MTDYEKLKKFINEHNKDIITIQEFKNNNINFYQINKLIEDQYISRMDRGIYKKSNSEDDSLYSFQYRYKNTIFSYNTALYLLNKLENAPKNIDITVPGDYHVELDNKSIKIHYTNRNNINLGVTTIKTPQGNEVNVYNLERTICDLIKNSEKIEIDHKTRNKIIREAFDQEEINIIRLLEYAKQLKCDKTIKTIVDILI